MCERDKRRAREGDGEECERKGWGKKRWARVREGRGDRFYLRWLPHSRLFYPMREKRERFGRMKRGEKGGEGMGVSQTVNRNEKSGEKEENMNQEEGIVHR